MPDTTLRRPRGAALAAIALLVVTAAVASFAESYRALMIWATAHSLHGLWAGVFPVQVDSFIAVGELALFVALADRWTARSRAGAWAVTAIGLAVSVAANVGHVAGHDFASRLTAAVPPLAASAALAVGLGVLKRVVASKTTTEAPAEQPVTADVLTARTPSLRLAWPQPVASRSAPAAPRERRTRSAASGKRRRRAPVTIDDAALRYASEIESGRIPSMRRVRAEMRVGQPRAQAIVAHLSALAEAA